MHLNYCDAINQPVVWGFLCYFFLPFRQNETWDIFPISYVLFKLFKTSDCHAILMAADMQYHQKYCWDYENSWWTHQKWGKLLPKAASVFAKCNRSLMKRLFQFGINTAISGLFWQEINPCLYFTVLDVQEYATTHTFTAQKGTFLITWSQPLGYPTFIFTLLYYLTRKVINLRTWRSLKWFAWKSCSAMVFFTPSFTLQNSHLTHMPTWFKLTAAPTWVYQNLALHFWKWQNEMR